jgi:hypothetical protein
MGRDAALADINQLFNVSCTPVTTVMFRQRLSALVCAQLYLDLLLRIKRSVNRQEE